MPFRGGITDDHRLLRGQFELRKLDVLIVSEETEFAPRCRSFDDKPLELPLIPVGIIQDEPDIFGSDPHGFISARAPKVSSSNPQTLGTNHELVSLHNLQIGRGPMEQSRIRFDSEDFELRLEVRQSSENPTVTGSGIQNRASSSIP